ncbi:MAG TPA: hypothetical protein VKD22_14960, partial [Ramlibacter sp.]|nr:hypothetical protein [Ramlibacter sp.]
ARAHVSVLRVATPPAVPAWPKPAIMIGAAGLAGLLIAIAAALARESGDIRLRSLEDVTGRLGQPVVAILGRRQAALPQPAHEHLLLKQS